MHIHECKLKSQEELQLLDSLFLISSWSYSKVMQYARNPKCFEMLYIYGYRAKASATTVAGQAYHYALEMFFKNKKEGVELSMIDLETLVFNYIDEQPRDNWKLQKTTPTVEDCKIKANESALKGIRNFYNEINVYLDEIEEILEVELFFSEFLTINGVDILMPCNGKIDLKFRSKSQKIILADHKLRASYTPENEIALTSGKQAVIYTKAVESVSGEKVDEVWFFENKTSGNKDKSPQIQLSKIEMTEDTVRLYESLVYEPLRAVLKATSDPDHVYLINDSDNFVDMAEIYEFWTKTMMGETDGFNFEESKRELIELRTKKIRDASINIVSPKAIKQFRENASRFIQYDMNTTEMTQEQKIEHILRSFNIISSVKFTFSGYSSNTYLLEFNAGVKIGSVQKYRLDIASQLNVSNVRIPSNLVVHERKAYLAIETSKKRERDLLWDKKELKDLKIPIGKDNLENLIHWDLNNQSTAHMLISGTSGFGKSVSLISTIEYAKIAKGIDKIIIMDVKYEFLKYKSKKIEVYNEILDIENKLKELVEEMNHKVKNGISDKITLVIIDEFADAVAQSRKGKQLDIMEMVEDGFYAPKKMMGIPMPPQPKMKLKKTGERKSLSENLGMLLQKGRSSGFRILAATQRASSKTISGDFKVNMGILLSFRVPKTIDSIVVLDEPGAELLQEAGAFLIKSPELLGITTGQGFWKKQE